jgi:hypothetical protein
LFSQKEQLVDEWFVEVKKEIVNQEKVSHWIDLSM